MKLVSKETQCRDIANIWLEYHPGIKKSRSSIYQQLVALDGKGTEEEITKITGTTNWISKSKCDDCGDVVEAVVQLGEEPDYESSTAWICGPCLKKALDLLET